MNDIQVVNLSQYTQPVIKEQVNRDWVEYGEKDEYYSFLIDRYRNSATNNAVINNISRLIYGKGLSAYNAHQRPQDYARLVQMFSKETLRNIAFDLKCLGSGAFQIIYSKDRKSTPTVEHLPTNLLRPEKCNEKGDIEAYYYSDNWGDVRKYPPKRIPVFGTSKENIEILVFGRYSVGRKYFHSVDYEGALDYAVLEEEIASYLINETQNSFSPTMIVNFNNGQSTEEQRRQTARNVENKLTGSTGKKVVISFNDNAEARTTVDAIPLNDAPDHYNTLSTEARNKILVGHNVTSPMLVGISPDGQGFSSNADEINTASTYFHNTVIVPFQEMIIDAIKEILAFNGISLDVYFKRLNFLEDVEADRQKKEAVTMSSQKIEDIISMFGEEEDLEGWELVDEREVDYDLEDDFNAQLREYFAPEKKSLLSKIWEFATGTATPNQASEQDKEIDGFFFKVRYQYTGSQSPERSFCKAMMRANKVYRKEDIDKMSKMVVNAGFGEFGADTYDIFKYKGGARCNHKWLRRTYVSTSKNASIGSSKTKQVSTNKAEKFGYVVRNPKEVAMIPNDMPLKGFSPNNPNLPSDVR